MSRYKAKILTYFIIVSSTFLLLWTHPQIFSPLRFAVVKATAWPAQAFSLAIREMKKILFYHRIFDEYVRLREENNVLETRLMALDEVIRENNRLEQLLNFKRNLIYSTVAANVIGRDPSNWNATVIIDKGTEDGLQVGMPVVRAQGVVGKIAETEAQRSKVILLSDPSFSVPALVLRSRESGLVSGTLLGMSRMRYLSSRADIKVGDTVITSKLSSSFPEGLMIGKVISVQYHERNPIVDCIIQPAVNQSQIEEVLVILKD